MAVKTYFSGLADINLAKDVIAKKPELFIQKYEYIGSGVYANTTTGTSTLTPATSPAWTIDELISSVALNLLIVDDNGKACQGKVSDNTATAITFDESAMLLEEDGVTAGTFTAGRTYNFYVLSPSADNTYGPFFGYTEGEELNLTEEYMQFKYGMPRKKKFQDLAERNGQIIGGTVNFDNEDILATVLNADAYGKQTGQFSYGIGSDPNTNNYYRLTFVGEDREGRVVCVIVRKTQIGMNGNMFQKSEAGYFMLSFTADILADGFYPDDVDMIQVIRVD